MARATIEEVATAAGVSRSTVSRVVNGSAAVSPETLAAVRSAISHLDYIPNRAARSLASRQTYAIALVVPEDTTRFFGDPFFAAVVAGISARLAESDYILTLLVASDDPGEKVTSFVRNGGVDAAIIVSHHTSDSFVERIAQCVPVVYGGRPGVVRDAPYIIDVDNVRGGRMATEHLLARGCRRIAMITGSATMGAAQDRRQGYRDALAAAGLESAAEIGGGFSEAGGAAAARRLLMARQRPDGVFVASDLMAAGALRILREEGLRVPEDIALVGYDDSSVATTTDPPLTTVRQPMHALGERMGTVIIDVLSGGSPEALSLLPIELVVRASA